MVDFTPSFFFYLNKKKDHSPTLPLEGLGTLYQRINLEFPGRTNSLPFKGRAGERSLNYPSKGRGWDGSCSIPAQFLHIQASHVKLNENPCSCTTRSNYSIARMQATKKTKPPFFR